MRRAKALPKLQTIELQTLACPIAYFLRARNGAPVSLLPGQQRAPATLLARRARRTVFRGPAMLES